MITIRRHTGSVSLESVQIVESEIGVTFPKSYVDFILPNDGCYISPRGLVFFENGLDSISGSCISDFMQIKEDKDSSEDLLSMNISAPEFFPKDIVAFGHVGNGDLICFDYRKGKENLDPPVVYWSHEAEEGKDVSFLADNFEAFLKILKTDEEMDELLK